MVVGRRHCNSQPGCHGRPDCQWDPALSSETLWTDGGHQGRETGTPARTQQRDVMSQPHSRSGHQTDQEWTEGKKATWISEEEISEPRGVCFEYYKLLFWAKTFTKYIFHETIQFNQQVGDIAHKCPVYSNRWWEAHYVFNTKQQRFWRPKHQQLGNKLYVLFHQMFNLSTSTVTIPASSSPCTSPRLHYGQNR